MDKVSALLPFLVSFFAAMLFAPAVITLIKKMKASQTILVYVEQHKEKQGTPTMGGLIFILVAIISFNRILIATWRIMDIHFCVKEV